jgi:hypothetical protein
MTAAVTTVRQAIAAVLENPTEWNTYSYVPASPTANSVVLQPADPYVTSNNNSHLSIQPMFHFIVTCIVPMLDNQGSLDAIEQLAFDVWATLAGDETHVYNIGGISAPTLLGDAGNMLAVEMTVDLVGSWT